MTERRWNALIIRVWLEDGPESFRARLTALDPYSETQAHSLTIAVASSPTDVITAVGEWLDGFLPTPDDTEGGVGDT